MPRRRTLKNRKSLRRKSMRGKRRTRGAGWSDGPDMVNPGNLVHHQYSGPGKDCTGNPHSYRPGYIFGYDPKGLPGFSGGKRRNRNRKSRGGASMPPVATIGPVTNPNLPPVSGSVTPKPGDFPNTTGTAGTVANPDPMPKVVMSMPGVPTPPGAAQMPVVPIAELSKSADAANLAPPPQNGGRRRRRNGSRKGLAFVGGRYGFFPGMGPLNPENGVGTTPGPFGRIPCEVGTYNPLNPDPNGIQTMSTAPLTPPYVTGRFMGGGSGAIPAGTTYAASAANFPTVQVGQADSMRYYSPTAGYRNDFMTFQAPSPVPGLTIQTPYDAKAFNQACIKTGGSRRNRKGGAMPVAFDAGKFTPVTMGEIWTRKDFDGSNQGLPVKFGGKHRSSKTHRKARKARRTRRNRN